MAKSTKLLQTLLSVGKAIKKLSDGSVRVFKTKTGLKYCIDLPGFSKEQVKVSVVNSVATVSAIKKTKKEVLHLNVPANANPEPSLAKLENGVLTLVFDKKEAVPAKDVPVG
jgi:HSP20 family molecular chaperone IbpA